MVEGGLYRVSARKTRYGSQILVCYNPAPNTSNSAMLVIYISRSASNEAGYYNIVYSQEFGIVEMSVDYIYTPAS